MRFRRSGAIRVAIAVVVGAGITVGAITALWGPLGGQREVIGYPIFSNFNPYNYAYAYYLVVLLFPLASLLIFAGLTRIGHHVGLAPPPARGPLRPSTSAGDSDVPVSARPSLRAYGRLAAAARVASVGAVLGLAVGVASLHPWRSVLLVAVAYSLILGVGAVALGGLVSARSGAELRLATLNALGATLTVAGLSLVSAHTEVRVLAGGTVHHYPWFPAWLGLPLAAALCGWILVSLRRAGPGAVAAIERRAVALIAAPVALFVLAAHLPGDLGPIELFERGQSVTETMLLGQGWLPWRDVVLTHGLLGDVAPTALGWGIFGHSYWASYAGASLIFYPLAVVTTYLLLAYVVGRSWPLLVIVALMFLGTWFGVADPRFILWPPILLLLAAVLKHSTRPRAAALGVLAMAQAIVTPELAPGLPIVAVVCAAYEWYWRQAGAGFAQAFRRTIWLTIGAVVSGAIFAVYMASQGALGDVINVTTSLVAGHFDMGIPPTAQGSTQGRFDFIALAPVAAVLTSFAYAAVRLRLRRPFRPADWPMAAVALLVLVYYTKFLARMDFPHALEPFMVATPLMIYIIYRAVTDAERWISSRVPSHHARWVPAHPGAIAILVVFGVLFWGSLHTTVDNAPAAYRQPAPRPPAVARVGYAAYLDRPAVQDLQRIVNAYLGPHDRLMDLTDEPALFYYFFNRGPSSRWYAPVSIVDTPQLQSSLLTDLRRTPPKLIIFDDTDVKMYGLTAMDGVPGPVYLYLISRWVLSHYKPLLQSHGRTIYALPGLPALSTLHLRLHQRPATTEVGFRGQACSWGDAPTFLSGPAEPSPGAQAVAAPGALSSPGSVTYRGWAGDVAAGEPAREVVATFNGKVVARATPGGVRPDVPAAGYPAGFLHTGFALSIPVWANATKALRVFAVGRNGSVAELAFQDRPGQGGVATINGRPVTMAPKALTGHLEAVVSASGPSIRVSPPAGSAWGDYRWLEVDAPSGVGFTPGQFTLSDQAQPSSSGRTISFSTLASSPRRYLIPVSSCAQWRAYGSRPLFLTSSTPQEFGHVSLIR